MGSCVRRDDTGGFRTGRETFPHGTLMLAPDVADMPVPSLPIGVFPVISPTFIARLIKGCRGDGCADFRDFQEI